MASSDEEVSPGDIFTTIRYDPDLRWSLESAVLAGESKLNTSPLGYNNAWYMFQFHLDRLRASASQFQCVQPSASIDHLAALESELENQFSAQRKPVESDVVNPAWRVRLVLTSDGGIKIDQLKPAAAMSHVLFYPRTLDRPPPLRKPLYELFICPHPTIPSSFTRHKTAKRDVYTAARVACNLPAAPTADPEEVLLWNPAGELMEGSLTSVYRRRDGDWVTPAVACGGNEGTTRRWAVEFGICAEGVIMVEDLIEGEVLCISNGVRGFIYGLVRRKFFDAARGSVAG